MADNRKETPEYRAMRDLALEQLRSGKSLTGEGGVFAPIIKEFLESALSAEDHLSEEERSSGNKRNGKGTKKIKNKFRHNFDRDSSGQK
jgi:putative transposase